MARASFKANDVGLPPVHDRFINVRPRPLPEELEKTILILTVKGCQAELTNVEVGFDGWAVLFPWLQFSRGTCPAASGQGEDICLLYVSSCAKSWGQNGPSKQRCSTASMSSGPTGCHCIASPKCCVCTSTHRGALGPFGSRQRRKQSHRLRRPAPAGNCRCRRGISPALHRASGV